jgi:phage shock protein A
MPTVEQLLEQSEKLDEMAARALSVNQDPVLALSLKRMAYLSRLRARLRQSVPDLDQRKASESEGPKEPTSS